MATSRSWRPSHVLDGPYQAKIEEIVAGLQKLAR